MDTEMPTDDETFADIEAALRKLKPAALSNDLLSRLANAMTEAAEENPDNIITMDEIRRGTQVLAPVVLSETNKTSNSPFKRIAVAAAVAIMGAAAALYVTQEDTSTRIVDKGIIPNSPVDATVTDSAVSANTPSVAVAYDGTQPMANSPLKEKTLWRNNDSPHKSIIVNYTRIYQTKDKDGNPVEISVPATRCIQVPNGSY